jgi:hypothetical protein
MILILNKNDENQRTKSLIYLNFRKKRKKN